MNYEKEYKKKLEDAKYWHDCSEGDIPAILEEIFSELKESNDEKIRKAISYAIANSTHEDGILINGVTESEAIAWLEKQGMYKFEHGDDNATKVFKNEDGTKKEPKFKVGDWVVREYEYTDIITINQVVDVKRIDDEHFGYTLDDETYFSGSWESSYHLWTIQDAKDGDVLVVEDKNFVTPFVAIYKSLGDTVYEEPTFNSHCFIGFNGNFYTGEEGHVIEGIHPATKEQRELLFSKMKEAGFNWDAKKKILTRFIRTIKPNDENTSSTWREEDENILEAITYTVKNSGYSHCIGVSNETMIDWLRSLKDRAQPQPQKEWREEDEWYLKSVISRIKEFGDSSVFGLVNNDIQWLKSLKQGLKGE